jgi:hypothetical protein
MRFGFLIVSMISCLATPSAGAQWLKHPTAALPRTTDGQPDLQAPAPRTADGKPDFTGIWGWAPGRYAGNISRDLKPDDIQAWARALAEQRMEDLGKDDPSNIFCLPQGPRLNLFAPLLAKIVQTPTLILILSEDMTYRQIFLDGRSLPVNPAPSFMGYSVGRWDGDTLVVETVGFKDRTWLDFGGRPHTEALRITERITRQRVGRLDIEETLEDPAIFARPWSVTLGAQLVADTELLEYVCQENEKSRVHMVGKASDDAKSAVAVAPEILAKYVGTYEYRLPENPTTPMFFTIRMEGGTLYVGARPLIPLSETSFGGGGRLEVVRDARGDVVHLLVIGAEGELKAVRVPAARSTERQ